MATFENAKALGVEVKQEWLATLDGRTRYSHRRLDGEKVEVGGTFSNGLRYPGDPQGSYAETCNCRCTLVAAIDGVDTSDAERWSRLPEGMTYAEWRGEPAKPDLTKYIGGRYEPFDTITKRQGGYIFAAWKRGALDAEKEQIDMMYGRYVSDGPSRPSTDATAVGVAGKLRTCINAIAANDKPAATYAFEQFVDAHYLAYSDSRFPDVRGKLGAAARKVREAVRDYVDESRKMNLVAPGFRPRPRKAVKLPKEEYANVMSAINNAYHARFEGKEKARIAIGNNLYTFEISDFGEYKITKKEPLA